ncbi:L-histidine N(alpha)-methyltransferase [Intrasporangium mesophilum]
MTVAISRHLQPEWRLDRLKEDVRAGLTSAQKSLPPKYFYDQHGSELFDQITRLPEYYPTRTERVILDARASDVAGLTRAETLIELGSGTSDKTRLLLDALRARRALRRFVPFDVDGTVLAQATEAVAADYPGLDVLAVVGDFEHHIGLLPKGDRRLVAFLGSTIGNFEPGPRAEFLDAVHATLEPGDWFLLGTDLVKDASRLVAAYDDPGGVTAAFNRNVLAVINRDLGADFDLSAFDHVAVWDADQEWVEMRLRSNRQQVVHVTDLSLDVHLDRGEQIRTEISAKFRRGGVHRELQRAGLRMARWWTDPGHDFALSLSTPL